MSYYNNNRYTPGNKSNLRKFINNQSIINDYINYITFINAQYGQNILEGTNNILDNNACMCITQSKANDIKQGYLDPSISESFRIAQRIKQSNLGGRITFGNNYQPITIDYLGGWQGQPGGSFRPPRNKF